MPINECVGHGSFTGCFEADGIVLPLAVGSIDSATGLIYSGFMLLMTGSRPANVQNGADQVKAGRTLTLRSRKDKQVLYGRQVTDALIDVSDTGTAIPHKVRKRLFNPFLTAKEEGTGLRPAKAVRRGMISS